jgi:hypothetical protein
MTRLSTLALAVATSATLATLIAATLCLAVVRDIQSATRPLPAGCSRAFKPIASSTGPVLVEIVACRKPGTSV